MTSRQAWLLVLIASILLSPRAAGQEQVGDLPRFKVAVDAVRIDAVVTDRDGRIVRDLAAADFIVLQNGKPQPVTFAQFVPVAVSSAAASAVSPLSSSTSTPAAGIPPPASTLMTARAAIQRTLAVVVDDLGLSVESLYYVKRALDAFIDREVQPTDLVSIIRTGGSIGSLQPFTTDRRVLHGVVDQLRWNGFSRSGVEPFEPLNEWTTFDERSGLGDPNDFTKVNAFRRSFVARATLGSLNLAIRAARDLPGRKALLFVSEGFQMFDVEDTRLREAVDAVIDQATRAGVVIYSLDPRGLQTAGLQASDNLKRAPPEPDGMEGIVRQRARDRLAFNRDTQEGLAYVAEQTGGFAVLNTNDLARGFERISADVRDYYIIGYTPERGTFVGEGKKPQFHGITVKVRRTGLRVRTRRQFLGVSDVDAPAGPRTPKDDLIRAAISPFTSMDIGVRATPLPGWSPERGLFVRTLLHIDARALAFVEDAQGRRTASADVLGMVFDADGTEVAHLTTGFEVGLTDAATDDALQRGLAYTLLVPVPRAGGFQLRFAVRDRHSGKLGSAGEFVEIADVPRGAFALSGIVLQSGEGAAQRAATAAIGVVPEQALRAYATGTPLTYACDIYNAAERVEVAISVWRGAQRVASLPARTLLVPAGRGGRLTITGGFKLGESLPPGSYMLQVAAATADASRKDRVRTAVQRLHFDLRSCARGCESAPGTPEPRRPVPRRRSSAG